MVDTATITRPGDATFDPNTGLLTPSSATVHSGSCRLRWPTGAEQEVVFGDRVVTRTRALVAFPHDITAGEIGDIVTLTASGDASAVGRPFRIVAVPSQTFNMYREYGCEVIDE